MLVIRILARFMLFWFTLSNWSPLGVQSLYKHRGTAEKSSINPKTSKHLNIRICSQKQLSRHNDTLHAKEHNLFKSSLLEY